MHEQVIWVLVADGARARVLRAGRQRGQLELLWEEASAAARRKVSELESDRQGRAFESGPGGRRSAMAPPSDPKQLAKERFAKRLAGRIEHELPSDARLVLVAAPHALGDLRAHLAPSVMARVVEQLDKDLTASSPTELAQQLGPHLWPPA